MDLKENYTINELSEIFNCSTRTIQRNIKTICDTLSHNSKNKKIPVNIAIEIAKINNWEFQKQRGGQLVVEEYFTEKEYNEFYKRLEEYPYLKEKVSILLNELDYHKKASENHKKQVDKIQETYFNHMEKFFKALEQRNFLEATNKFKNNQ